MRALIIYPSQGGQAEQVACRIATQMTEEGAAVDLYNVAEERADEIAVDAYDAVILGSPSHHGHYDARIEWCIREYRQFLSEVPTAFFSVSHQASRNRNGAPQEEIRRVDEFIARLNWKPSMRQAFPAAQRDDEVSLWRFLAWLTEKPATESADDAYQEFIDWESVDDFVRRLMRVIFSCKQPAETRPRFDMWSARPRHEYSVVPFRR